MHLLFFLVALVAVYLAYFWNRVRKYPKGPTPLPLIGNVLSFWKLERWESKMVDWAKEYGPIYTLWFGSEPIVTVNDYETAVNMFVKDGDNYADRVFDPEFDKATRGGNLGVINTSGHHWREQRRFAIRILRDFGLGKNRMQDRILDELQTILVSIDRDINAGIEEHDFYKYTDIAVGSVINSLICGYRFTTNNKEAEFYKMKDITVDMMKVFSNPLLRMSMKSKVVKRLPYVNGPFNKAISLFNQVFDFLDIAIDQHIKQNDYTGEFEPQDFIDAFLIEKAKENSEERYFTRAQLRNMCFDMWFAGQETTSTTLSWVIAYLINYPEVQKKMHDEMDKVIGENRMITVADRPNLPYTCAAIMEAQRCANIVAINVPRKMNREVTINGIHIPAGSTVIPQIAVIMNDPKIFPDAENFNPDRFIDEKGQLKHVEEVIPFSIGKRICLGEGLARMELFLFTANLFHQYKFSHAKQPTLLKRRFNGSSALIQPYNCRVSKRF